MQVGDKVDMNSWRPLGYKGSMEGQVLAIFPDRGGSLRCTVELGNGEFLTRLLIQVQYFLTKRAYWVVRFLSNGEEFTVLDDFGTEAEAKKRAAQMEAEGTPRAWVAIRWYGE